MTKKKTRFSTSRNNASGDREAIDTLVGALNDCEASSVPDEIYEDLSDLSRAAADRLVERWADVQYPVRLAIVQEMVNRFETDIEHHYDRALIAALHDSEPEVKLIAFEGLTDTTEPRLLRYLLEYLPSEETSTVRAAGARALGQFVLQAEMEKLAAEERDRVRDVVMTVVESDPDPDVRLQMLESAGYLSGDPEVIDAIHEAWESGSHDDQVSALRAMGRQSDPRWLDIIVEQFKSDEPEIRFEAARSAGNIGGQSIVPQLVDLSEDDDVEVQMAAIGSLGAIGGESAISALRQLEQSESPAIADAADAALEEALLVTSVTRPPRSLW
jgi:HEAT repeat protein